LAAVAIDRLPLALNRRPTPETRVSQTTPFSIIITILGKTPDD
jgi:hypothetical protein